MEVMHSALGLIASTCSAGVCQLAPGSPEGTSRYCWEDGVQCKGMCAAGKMCVLEGGVADF